MRLLVTALICMVAGIMTASIMSFSPVAAGQTLIGPAPTDANVSAMAEAEKTNYESCGIAGFFGGMLCDITQFFAEITDASFAMLNVFLKVPPFTTLDTAGNESATYAAWSLFRGIANGLFVVAFLVIIYTHVTGVGVSNYSIKRMLPRIIVASLLVNISFYVSALAVDLSNILGVTLKDVMEAAGNQAIAGDGSLVKSAPPQHGTWSTIAGSILLVGGAVGAIAGVALYGTFSVFLPVLASAAIAIVTTVLILMIRQVLIIIFIILSPLAFAAMILPNTTKYFEKWKSLFIPVLLVFPAVSLLYGAGHIASIAIHAAAAGNDSVLLSVAALGVQIVPLLLTPAVMKIGSGLIDRWGGISQTPGKAFRKKSEDYAKKLDTRADLRSLNRTAGLDINPRSDIRKRRMAREMRDKRINDTRDIAGELDFRGAIEDTTPTLLGGDTTGEALQRQMAQSKDVEDVRRAKNHVIEAKVKAHAKDVEAKAIADQYKPRQEALMHAMSSNSTISALEKEAAIMRLASVGDVGAILDMMKASGTMTIEQRQTLLRHADKSGASSKIPFLMDGATRDSFLRGELSADNFISKAVVPSMARGDFSASELATDIDKDGLDLVADAVEAIENGDDELLRALGQADLAKSYTDDELRTAGREKLKEYQDTAYAALTVEHTALKIDKNLGPLQRIAQNGGPI